MPVFLFNQDKSLAIYFARYALAGDELSILNKSMPAGDTIILNLSAGYWTIIPVFDQTNL